MTSIVQKRLRDYLDNSAISVAELERKAGLKINVARNVLKGQSKKPTVETLQALANVLGCTVHDLLEGRTDSAPSESRSLQANLPELDHPEILRQSLQCILKIVTGSKEALTVKQTLLILEEVYAYSIKKDPANVDPAFVKWFIERTVK